MHESLVTYLEERRNLIEFELNRRLPATDERPARLGAAMRHAVLGGGKRLRPIMCLAAAEAAGGQYSAAMPAALSVELLHSYTLVHDDLPCMDDDVERRGRPTVHIAFGEAIAVLAGDALQSLAFETLAATPESRPGKLAAMLRAFASAAGAGGVVGGQIEDIGAPSPPNAATIAFVHRLKTAVLFETALRLGALAVDAAPEITDRLAAYGLHLGMAFQIRDDLLDRHATGRDGRSELSCLAVLSPGEAVKQATELIDRACAALEGLPGPVAPLDALARELLSGVAKSVRIS